MMRYHKVAVRKNTLVDHLRASKAATNAIDKVAGIEIANAEASSGEKSLLGVIPLATTESAVIDVAHANTKWTIDAT